MVIMRVLKKLSKKKVIAILIIIILLIALFPDVQSNDINIKPSPDYGIYNSLEEIQDEKNSRINTPVILNETRGRFDNITLISGEEKVDLTAGREVVSPDIPVPEMLGIYNAMKDWDKTYNKQITDWILPWPLGTGGPLNYYIYSKYITNTSIVERWRTASLRKTVIYPEPNISNWWGVDVDNDTVNDIEVYFDPSFEFRDISIIPPRYLEAGVTVHYNIRKLNDAPFSMPDFVNLEVYVAKSLSYSGKNFILFIGLNLTNIVAQLDCSVTVHTVRVEGLNITIIPGIPPSTSIDLGNIANLAGPYYLSWDSGDEELSSLSLEVATARIEFNGYGNEPYKFLNRSWVDLDFNKIPPYNTVPKFAELMVDADDDLSSFNKIEWDADHPCDAYIRFFDEQQNVSYAEIEINDLPVDVDLFMYIEENGDQNITIIDYIAEDVVNYLLVHHYQFFDTRYENISAAKINMGEIEYIHLFLNISRIPKKLYLRGLFYLEEIEDLPSINPGTDIIGQIVNSIVHRVISRFTRIAKTLGSIPYRLVSIAEEGSFATVDTYYDQIHDDIDEIEFIFTSGDYVTTTGNYFAFYNNTRPSKYPIAQISLSGRITKVIHFNASFEEDALAELKMMNNERFRAIYADDINSLNAEVNISNVPNHITVSRSADILLYDGHGTSMNELRFLSDYQGSYMDFRILNMADRLYVEYKDDRTYITTGPTQGNIGEIEFLVTTGPIYRLNGNHLLLRQEPDFSLLSGRIRDLSELEYIPGEGGKLDLLFTRENTLNISLLDNRSEIISADLIIDPMPSFVSVNLSGLFAKAGANFSLPKLDSTGVLGLANIIFGIAALGNEILAVVDEATQDALSNVGNIIQDLSFSYKTTTHITLIGKILRGKEFTLNDVDWMHGISAVQQTTSEGTAMAAKLYLSGLPTEAGISTRVVGDDIFLGFHLIDYVPKHNWLCIDVRGLQDRDVMLYINNISLGMNLDLKVGLSASLNIIPQRAMGNIHINSDKRIGALYGRLRQTSPELTVTEFFLSSLPKTLDTFFILSGAIIINFQASTGIEHMFVKNVRTRNGEFHDIYAILHELPDQLALSVLPVIDYDMDDSPLQTLPSISMSSSGSTLDAFIFADGKGIGQVGIVEFQAVNVPLTLSGNFSDEKYRIKSTGVDYLWIHAMELPIMEGHKTKSIEIVGKDILSFDISVGTLFGNYPMISIDNAKGGEVQIVFDHEMNGDKAGLAFIDFKTTNGLPSSPSILINGGSVNLEKGSSHLIVPAPILTMWLTIFS